MLNCDRRLVADPTGLARRMAGGLLDLDQSGSICGYSPARTGVTPRPGHGRTGKSPHTLTIPWASTGVPTRQHSRGGTVPSHRGDAALEEFLQSWPPAMRFQCLIRVAMPG